MLPAVGESKFLTRKKMKPAAPALDLVSRGEREIIRPEWNKPRGRSQRKPTNPLKTLKGTKSSRSKSRWK